MPPTVTGLPTPVAKFEATLLACDQIIVCFLLLSLQGKIVGYLILTSKIFCLHHYNEDKLVRVTPEDPPLLVQRLLPLWEAGNLHL